MFKCIALNKPGLQNEITVMPFLYMEKCRLNRIIRWEFMIFVGGCSRTTPFYKMKYKPSLRFHKAHSHLKSWSNLDWQSIAKCFCHKMLVIDEAFNLLVLPIGRI